LLAATETQLSRITQQVKRRTRTPLTAAEIGLKVGRVLNRYKMAKHFTVQITDGQFQWARNLEAIERERQLDGLYVIRTSEPEPQLSAPNAVRHYKSLSQVEQAFRCLKGTDLRVRPIHHRTEDHVRAHLFLCLLAYYVEWHMREALAPLLFADPELKQNRATRNPVNTAKPSASVQAKKALRLTADGLPVHSFDSLLEALATRCRNTCRVKATPSNASFSQLTEPTLLQARAYQLLGL
jgi:transposase